MEQARTKDNGVTFAVHDVEKATDLLETWKTRDGIIKIVNNAETGNPEETVLISCSGYNSDTVVDVYQHALIWAVHLAFSQHRPLILSPDMIWVTILQGLALHIRNHSELLRHRFVGHDGRIKLAINRTDVVDGSPENAWEEMVEDFSLSMSEMLGGKYDDLLPNFSTTGPLERTVCQIALMDAYSPYFSYDVYCICGIPSITLEGDLQDWRELRQKLEAIVSYELEWWAADLRIILDQFVKAADGNADIEFWQNIYKQTHAYGTTIINGWIARFLPYLKYHTNGSYSSRNKSIGKPMVIPPEEPENVRFAAPDSVSMADIPPGLSLVPVTLSFPRDKQRLIRFVGGFVGIDQSTDTFALRPKLGWAVIEASRDDLFYDELAKKCNLRPAIPLLEQSEHLRQIMGKAFAISVPSDFIRFYKNCDGLDFGGADAIEFLRMKDVKQFIPAQIVNSLDEFHNAPSDNLPVNAKSVEVTMSSWAAFAILPDGNYVALNLLKTDAPTAAAETERNLHRAENPEAEEETITDNKIYKVCKVNAKNKNAIIIAHSFSEFLLNFIESDGKIE